MHLPFHQPPTGSRIRKVLRHPTKTGRVNNLPLNAWYARVPSQLDQEAMYDSSW